MTAMMFVCASTVAYAQTAYTVLTPSEPAARETQPEPLHRGPVVSVSVSDSTVSYTIEEIARRAQLRAIFNKSDPAVARRVSLHVTNVPALSAMATLLAGSGLTAKMTPDGDAIMIGRVASDGARSRTLASGIVAGRITDSASGQGLGGAAVRIAGTNVAAVTSDSGNFTLKAVPAGEQVLSVKLFGYRPAERTVTVVDSQRTIVRIALVSIPTVLSGVVTTATGTQRKVEIGNDITTLNVDSIRQVAPITSVTNLLEARVPGLTIMHTSGTPGDPSRLRLRGAGSISENNDPIIIVDGIRVYASQSDSRNNNLAPGPAAAGGLRYAAPSPIDQIDPNSIETVEVFKGPSASALYGSDAANGVIVITTKHGRSGPTHWDLDLGAGTNWIPGTWPENRYIFGYSQKSGHSVCYYYDLNCSVDSVVAFQALNDPAYTILSHGSDQLASLNVSGGVPTLTYNVTAGATGDLGNLKLPGIMKQQYENQYGPIPSWMVRPDQYQTWSVGGTMTAQPRPGLNATLSSTLFNSNQQRSSLEDGLSQLAQEFVNPYGILQSNGSYVPFATTPLLTGTEERVTDHALTSQDNVAVNWSPRPWLPITLSGGVQTMQRTDVSYIPFGVHSALISSAGGDDSSGSYGLGRGTSQAQTLSASTTVPLFSQRATVAVGGNLYEVTTNDFQALTNELAPGVSVPTTFITATSGTNCCSQSATSASTYGWFLEPRWNISQRFFLTPGFRLDGGSGASNSAGSVGGLSAFPKLDMSYLLVDRPPGQPMAGVLTQVRPRFSFGIAGTQPDPTNKLRLFNISSSNIIETLPGQSSIVGGGCNETVTLDGGATYTPAVCLNTLGNTQLRPERSSELEGGVDVNLWDSRLQLTYTQYNKTRKDAILSIPVAPSVAGVNGQTFNIDKNIGNVRNTGTEATINAILIQRRMVSWAVGANLSSDHNTVTQLNPGQSAIELNGGCVHNQLCTRIVTGYPIDGEWARPIVAYADANHDGIIEPNEIQLGDSAVYVGQETPNYQLNLTSDLTLLNGHLGIHATVAYQQGLTQYEGLSSTAFLMQNNAADVPLATQAALVAAECQNLFFGGRCADLQEGSAIGLLQTVSTLRLNDLSVTYEVPRGFASWFHAPRMVVALQGSNLGLHTNYRGKDPDVNAFSTVSAGDLTEDSGQIPEPRTWWLKLTLGN